jgi:heme exporter protein B
MKALFELELKYYFNNKQQAIYLISFLVSILLLIPFALEHQDSMIQSLAVMGLWIALTLSIALAAQPMYRRERESGRLEHLQVVAPLLEGVVLVKWAAFFLFLCLPLALVLPIAALLYQIPVDRLPLIATGLGAGLLALSLLAALVSAISSGLERAGAILSLVLLPLSIPVVIFGAAYCRDAEALWHPHLLFMLGFSGLALPAMCLAGAYSIRASH